MLLTATALQGGRVEDMTWVQFGPQKWKLYVIFRPLGRLDVENLDVAPPHEEGGGNMFPLAPLYIAIAVSIGGLMNTIARAPSL